MSRSLQTGSAAPAPLVAACLAEWTRLWSVRGTWWCLLAGTLVTVGIGAGAAAEAAAGPGPHEALEAWLAGELAVLPGQFALLVLALLPVTSEYGTGAITTSLQWTPRRGVLFAARVLVGVAVATVAGVVLALVADMAAWAILPAPLIGFGEMAESLGRIALVLAAGSLIAVGLGFFLRSTAAAIVAVFMLLMVLPFLLPAFGVAWMIDVARVLPGSAGSALLIGEPAMDFAEAALVLGVWTAGSVAAGALALLRRDAA